MSLHRHRYTTRWVAALLLSGALAASFAAAIGCDRDQTSGGGGTTAAPAAPAASPSTRPSASAGKPVKATVGYIGLTCEAPLFVAYENGFFRDEGLDVEMIKLDWNTLQESLAFGKVDANHTLVMYLLKPMEQGMNAKITAGVHTGCLRIQVAPTSPLKGVKELAGKRIGVPTKIGSPPFIFASRVLGANGVDVKKIDWKPYPPAELAIALDKGEIDALATSDPIGSLLMAQGKVRNLVDQAVDAPYRDEYCCVVVVSGKCIKEDPAKAAKLTRAILRGTKWVGTNPMAAAKMSVEKKYFASTPEVNAQALSALKYIPSVSRAKDALGLAAAEMRTAGMLAASTDPAALAQKAFLQLEGVTDDWVKTIEVETVAGGGPVPPPDALAAAALLNDATVTKSCCVVK
jgi:NitT/TauT family transport system substrate-binding protein